ncbi:SusD/RagB family nutrient-binding outer membrane lipoprotein [Aestuariivivens sp. NBU2969]|uniref:SusD/RagB family nutrient-binding outer membrane lipoprotein n=1 Tax=Aestuariivivens sp. NBU2969 TaxID=2873267 RepID=UPI001CBF7E7D|nr:SusD/RagB family nutrient-binding outer membrane lipoprotein [Aestuariivivens sp. NBU2969]
MKNIKYITGIIALLLILSCSDEYLDVNGSSSSPSNASPELLLPAAQKNSADMLWRASISNDSDISFNLIGGIHAGVISDAGDRVWYEPEQQYLILNTTYERCWENTYRLTLYPYHLIENFEEDGYDYYKAIAKIMKTFHFAMLVDTYGDIPYSDAFGRGNNTQPTYDEDKAVYDAIYDELNVAIDMIDNAPTGTINPQTIDAMFVGNMLRWKQFANTLKLRMLLRQVNTGENLSTKFSEISGNGIGFLVGTASIDPGYADQTDQQNPFYTVHGFNAGSTTPAQNHLATRGNEVYVNFLKDNDDPRTTRLFTPAVSDGEIRGIPQNVYTNDLRSEATSALGPGLLKSSSQRLFVMAGSESLFLQAEAVQRGFMPGDAGALYKAAIAASCAELDVPTPATAAATYESTSLNNLINWNTAVANGKEIEAIITQKWIAIGMISGFEVWMDRVRTNFPSFIPIPTGALSTTFPSNLLYPESEYATNSANVPTQGNNGAFDRHTFWMQ